MDEKEVYVFPHQAKAKLKAAKQAQVPVYIFGMTGFGKSALIRNYLGKKKYILFDAASSPLTMLEINQEVKDTILVVDNLQYADNDYLREKIRGLLKRRDIWLIFLSRCRCPDWLLDEYLIKSRFVTITEEELMLNREETLEVLSEYGLGEIRTDEADEIYRICRGHGLALYILSGLMLEQGESQKKAYVWNSDICVNTQRILWDYFEKNVYSQWDSDLQRFVMELSIVDDFTKELAQEITGTEYVGKYINRAQEVGNFLRYEDGTYRFEENVILSMRRRMELWYSRRKINELYYNAGRYFRRKGNVKKALDMFEKSENTSQITEILVENAKVNPGAGHFFELKDYYFRLSEEQIKDSTELMVGMCMLHSLMMNGEQSDYWYNCLAEKKEKVSRHEKKVVRDWLCYLDIALPHRGSENVASLISNTAKLLISREVNIPEFAITSNLPSQMNGGKDFCEWSKRDREYAKTLGKAVSLVFGKQASGMVNLALAESFLEKGESDYEVMRMLSLGQMAAQAKGNMEQCYVAVGLTAWLHIINGHIEDAEAILLDFKENANEAGAVKLIPDINRFLGLISLYRGDKEEVRSWMSGAPDENREFFCMLRMQYLLKVRVYIQYEKYEQAFMLLQKLRYYAEKAKRTYLKMECELLQSILEYRTGQECYAVNFQAFLKHAQEYHFVRIVSREGAAVQKLLKAQKWEVSDDAFFKQVCAETDRVAKAYPGYLSTVSGTEEAITGNALAVLRYQAEGLSYEEIGQELGITRATVKYHSTENYRKLGVNGKAAAIAEARKRHII